MKKSEKVQYNQYAVCRLLTFERVPMQVCDMEYWLNEHYEIRYNTILRNVQLRTLHEKLRKQPDDDAWKMLDDRLENEIWRQMQADGINFRIGDVCTLLLSKFPTEFDPLLTNLEGLPLWDGHTDYISLLADTVQVKSDQRFWRKMLQNFLVGMMDCYFTPGRANELMLIFLGSQGCYKTTWMEHLLPPELSEYYASYVQTDTFGKYDIIRFTNCLIINFDELEMQNSVQQNRHRHAKHHHGIRRVTGDDYYILIYVRKKKNLKNRIDMKSKYACDIINKGHTPDTSSPAPKVTGRCSKLELAKAYYPNHSDRLALQNLNRSIKKCKELVECLEIIRCRTRTPARSWFFSAEEVKIIKKLLGEP